MHGEDPSAWTALQAHITSTRLDTCTIDLLVDGLGVLLLGGILAWLLLRDWGGTGAAVPPARFAKRDHFPPGHYPPGHWSHRSHLER